MEWSESRAAWRLYVDETWLGYDRPTLYVAASDSRTFPTSGWQAVDGIDPLPEVEIFRQSASSSLVQLGGLEGSLWLKSAADYGTHEATCNTDEEDVEKAGHWCLSRCPPGYIAKNAHTCEQRCGGKMPAESWGLCGRTAEELYVIRAQTAAMVTNGGVKSYILVDDMRKNGVDGDKLSGTINTFIDMGKPFAHPKCPEFEDAELTSA